ISMVPLGLFLGFWVAFGALADLGDRAKLFRADLGTSMRRLFGLPRTVWATAIAHFGIGVTVIGIVATTAWERELVTTMRPGDTAELAGYEISFDGLQRVAGPNYSSERGQFTIAAHGDERRAEPERRVYAASGMPTTEAAIETFGFSQLYLQLGEPAVDGSQVVRAWYKPYILLIWLGAVLMALAGLLSLSYRRLRVGAPRPAAAQTAPAE
ncbi:MAG: cytochrome c-type biogenesis CcmF C-terminal domain-containing protein, partial [Gammaproteobacteria bacterium]